MKFIVVVLKDDGSQGFCGPYRTMGQAEGDAKAWECVKGVLRTYVEPLFKTPYDKDF